MPPKASLNVSLTPELTAYVADVVATGRYRTASEVLRAGLRLLQRDDVMPPTVPARARPQQGVPDPGRPGSGRRPHG